MPFILLISEGKLKDALFYSFLSGFLFGAGLLWWINVVNAPIKIYLYIGAFLLYCYFGLIFLVVAFFLKFLRNVYFFPVIWTGIEFLRGLSADLGFTWGSLPYAFAHHPEFLQFIDITGMYGFTFFVCLINVFIYMIFFKKRYKLAIVVILLIIFDYIYGKIKMKFYDSKKYQEKEVYIVQSAIPPEVKTEKENRERYKLFYEMTKRCKNCDLIIWSESALPSIRLFRSYFKISLKDFVASLGTGLVFGTIRYGSAGYYNSVAFCHGDTIEFYDKMYLVPFSERIPFEDIFKFLKKLHLGGSHFSRGREFKVFNYRGIKFCVLICWEGIFPRLVRKFVERGANLLINISEDMWFGRTSGPYQHAGMTVLRSIEYRRALVRCATAGISQVVLPSGRISFRTNLFERKIAKVKVPLNSGLTIYAKTGDLFSYIVLFLLIIFVAFRSRHSNFFRRCCF